MTSEEHKTAEASPSNTQAASQAPQRSVFASGVGKFSSQLKTPSLTKAAPRPLSLWDDFRSEILDFLPRQVVNNATTFLGGTHIVAEVLMPKGSGVTYFRHPKTKQLDITPQRPFINYYRSMMRMDSTSPVNHWSIRANATGLARSLIGAVMPENKDNIKQQEKEDRALYDSNIVNFYSKKLFQGINIFDINNKRETFGSAQALSGLFSIFSGFTNIDDAVWRETGKIKHITKYSQSIGGAISMIAGLKLWFGKDDQQAWSDYGRWVFYGLPVAGFTVLTKAGFSLSPSHFMQRKANVAKDWHYYAAAKAVYQASDMLAGIVGGTEKLEDGTVIERTHKVASGARIIVDDRGLPVDIPLAEVPDPGKARSIRDLKFVHPSAELISPPPSHTEAPASQLKLTSVLHEKLYPKLTSSLATEEPYGRVGAA